MCALIFDHEGDDDIENDDDDDSDNNTTDLHLCVSRSFLKICLYLSCSLSILGGWNIVNVRTPLVN